jgi:hypothetical protein
LSGLAIWPILALGLAALCPSDSLHAGGGRLGKLVVRRFRKSISYFVTSAPVGYPGTLIPTSMAAILNQQVQFGKVCCPYFQWPCRCVSPDAIPPSVPASGTPPCAKKAQEARNSPLHSQREIPHVRRPALSQERRRKKKSACSVLNDSGGSGHQAGLQGQIRLPAGWGSRGTRAARCYLYIEGRRCRFCWCRSRRW